ncbi:MAG: 5-bromo-4-chloroindolyl phosphate hydrolysis family protein [Pseudomonadota bacterium]
MAKRFGGKYSPSGASEGSTERPALARPQVDPVGARANLMFLPPIPLLFFALSGGAISLVLGLVGAAVLALGAWLLREGLRAEAAYAERKVARRPKLPRKFLAAALAGVGITIAGYDLNGGLIAPALFGIATLGLHLAAFGFDPMSDKGMEGIDTFQQDRVARVVDEAEAHLSAMTDAMKRAGDRQMELRLERFQGAARTLIRTVEEDPRDLTAARKYLGVYLLGARDATAKFADIYARNRDPQARTDYETLLNDLETGFAQKTETLLDGDRSDLNVEIDVLRERLQREGVRIAPEET